VTDTSGASDVQSLRVIVTDGTADVGVTIDDGVANVFPGDSITYTIVVTNHGDMLVPGESISTALSSLIENVTWICTPSSGATCSANGSGDIAETIDLPIGGSATYVMTGTVSAGASGTLDSTASVAPPAGYDDPNTTDNLAEDVDAVIDDRIFADGFDGG
jgi:hypothetical protein